MGLLSGSAELNYNIFDTTSRDKTTGETTKSHINTLDQLYSLNANLLLFPNIRFTAGSAFEYNTSKIKSNGTESSSNSRMLNPHLDIQGTSALYNYGLGYNRYETKSSGSEAQINEDYHGILGWKPIDLPTFNLTFDKMRNYDESKKSINIATNRVSMGVFYRQIRGLDLDLFTDYTSSEDKLSGIKTNDLTVSGRGTYSATFFNRVNVSSGYIFTFDNTQMSSGGAGEFSLQLFPTSGLYAASDTPTLGALTSLGGLIDGNITAPTTVNIGLPPVGPNTNLPRNIGLDLQNPTDVNEVIIWVDRNLPSQIYGYFAWSIYTTNDDPTQPTAAWSQWATVSQAAFGPYQNGYRFDIKFPDVKARAIKVVVSPLAPNIPGANLYPDIFVTEMQAFSQVAASHAKNSVTRISNLYNLSISTILTPHSEYNFMFTLNESDNIFRYDMVNAYSTHYVLNRIFSVTGSVGHEYTYNPSFTNNALTYSAGLRAVPLRTLNESLIYSGQLTEQKGRFTAGNSLYLTNNAQLYQGVSLVQSAGYSANLNEYGSMEENVSFLFGVSASPHRTLALGTDYSFTKSSGSGISTNASRFDANASYRPFDTLYIFTSYAIVEASERKAETLQGYGLNWSPFPGGAVQFNFTYSQNLDSLNNTKNSMLSPSVSWNILNRTYLDFAYARFSTDSDLQVSHSESYTLGLRKTF